MASIFSKLFGNKEVDKVLNDIDNVSQKYFRNSAETQTYDTLSKSAIQDATKYYEDKASEEAKLKNAKPTVNKLDSILSDLEVPLERLNRYDVYDHLYKSVQLIKRIITVYTNNIFQKDTINNEILIITSKESLNVTSESKLLITYIRQVIQYFKLDKKIKFHTGFNVLKYGDSFVEIIDFSKIKVDFPKINTDEKSEQKLLEEAVQLKASNSSNEYKKNLLNEDVFLRKVVPIVCQFSDTVGKTDKDQNLLFEFAEDNLESNSNKPFFNKTKLKDIVLRFHKPHKIIPLISPFESILGYVELSSIDRKTSSQTTNYFKEIASRFSESCNGAAKTNNSNAIIDKFSKEIVKTVLIKNNIAFNENDSMDQYVDSIHEKIGDDLFLSLKFLLLSPENLFSKKLNVRFIKSEDMFWFKTASSDYYPFGRSVIDPLVFPGKMYLFNQLANNITKLSKAASVRKWTVNIIGGL